MNEYILFTISVSLIAFAVGRITGTNKKPKEDVHDKMETYKIGFKIGVLSERKYPKHIKLTESDKHKMDNSIIEPPKELFIIEEMLNRR